MGTSELQIVLHLPAYRRWGTSLPCPIALPYRLPLHPGSYYLAEPDRFFYVERLELPLRGGNSVTGVGVRRRA